MIRRQRHIDALSKRPRLLAVVELAEPRLLRRRTFVFLAATLFSTSVLADRCPWAKIRIESRYEAPRGYEYVPHAALQSRLATGHDVLGLIETEIGWDVTLGFAQRCLGEVCRVCVDRIEGEAGFGPARQRVTEKLRRDRCRTNAVLAHEARHSRVFEEATRLGVRKLADRLMSWARRQEEVVAAAGELDSATDALYADIERIMEEGVAWIERRAHTRNVQIDSPEAYEKEWRITNRKCRPGS